MIDRTPTLRRAAAAGAYGLLGAIATAAGALVALYFLGGVQPALYGAVYLALGPSGATAFAILGHFVLAGGVAVAAATLLAEYAKRGRERLRSTGTALGVAVVLVVVYPLLSFLGVPPLGAALAWLVAAAVVVPVLLWVRFDVRSGGLPAFVGGAPVLLLLLVLAGVGVGWGWGYVVTAEEVAAPADGAATFEAAPAVAADLFAPENCETTVDGDRRCLLQLRGYEHELAAARFLDRHGVRCPYEGSGAAAGGFVARYEDRYYRVSCAGHGD